MVTQSLSLTFEVIAVGAGVFTGLALEALDGVVTSAVRLEVGVGAVRRAAHLPTHAVTATSTRITIISLNIMFIHTCSNGYSEHVYKKH